MSTSQLPIPQPMLSMTSVMAIDDGSTGQPNTYLHMMTPSHRLADPFPVNVAELIDG